jgi:hypothetical protein
MYFTFKVECLRFLKTWVLLIMERFGYNTPRYARLLDSDFSSSSDACNSGLTPIQCMDRIIPQGPPGLDALDLVMRESLQCEPGSHLHLGVSYALLRMQVRHFRITKNFRIFMPDLMILYVEPVCVAGGLDTLIAKPTDVYEGCSEVQSEISSPGVDNLALMHVRVFRFLTIPRESLDKHSGKRKAKRIDYASDDSDHSMFQKAPPAINSSLVHEQNQTSVKVSSTFQTSNTLRQRGK